MIKLNEKTFTFLAAMLLLLTFSCSDDPAGPTNIDIPEVPQQLGDGWPVSSLEEQGMDAEMIGKASYWIKNGDYGDIHSMHIVRHGYLVFDEYYRQDQNHGPDKLHNLNSVTKSVGSVLIGVAVQQGYLNGYEQSIIDFFPEYTAIINAHPQKQSLKLWHALTMTAGFEWVGGVGFQTHSDSYRMHHSSDPVRFVLEKSIIRTPGTVFQYCDGLSMLLSGIIKNATGVHADEFAEAALFSPLGITDYQWKKHQGSDLAEFDGGLRLRPRDLAKIGQLYFNKGKWEGQQIVPEDWVTASVKDWIVADESELDSYGFQWWLRPLTGIEGHIPKANDIFYGSGFGGQKLYVIPDLDMVVVFTGNCTNNEVEGTMARQVLYWHIVKAVKDI
ncbi:MAG: serine hydrolase domain-containing protein [Planctomycetota bacterium]|jgi:CubicO group peptidase (beta-lactamase class C family)